MLIQAPKPRVFSRSSVPLHTLLPITQKSFSCLILWFTPTHAPRYRPQEQSGTCEFRPAILVYSLEHSFYNTAMMDFCVSFFLKTQGVLCRQGCILIIFVMEHEQPLKLKKNTSQVWLFFYFFILPFKYHMEILCRSRGRSS